VDLLVGVLSLTSLVVIIRRAASSPGADPDPFLPGIRDIPRWIPLYRVIWRDHYRTPAR
jgi:hypothetical protein